MEPVKSSTQSGPSGRRRARATRSRITKAASELFAERGYVGTTMADIAAAAGVAVQTVYFVFHTKAEVLDSAYGLAVMGEDDPAVPQYQAWYRQALAEPDVSIAVQLVVHGLSEIRVGSRRSTSRYGPRPPPTLRRPPFWPETRGCGRTATARWWRFSAASGPFARTSRARVRPT